MKKMAAIAVLALIVAVPAFGSGVQDVTASEAKSLLAEKKTLVLLDVRTPEEYRQGRLHGSLLIPLFDLPKALGKIPRNRGVLVYCAVGGRSKVAATFLSAKGYPEVYNMTGGINGWQKNGYPVER